MSNRVTLDPAKLLGFRLNAHEIATAAKLGAKLGSKVGGKLGAKVGSKITAPA